MHPAIIAGPILTKIVAITLSANAITAIIVSVVLAGGSLSTMAWFLGKLSEKKRIKVLIGVIRKLEERLRKVEDDYKNGKEEVLEILKQLKASLEYYREQLRLAQGKAKAA